MLYWTELVLADKKSEISWLLANIYVWQKVSIVKPNKIGNGTFSRWKSNSNKAKISKEYVLKSKAECNRWYFAELPCKSVRFIRKQFITSTLVLLCLSLATYATCFGAKPTFQIHAKKKTKYISMYVINNAHLIIKWWIIILSVGYINSLQLCDPISYVHINYVQ